MRHHSYGLTSPEWSQAMMCTHCLNPPYIFTTTLLDSTYHEVSLQSSHQHDCSRYKNFYHGPCLNTLVPAPGHTTPRRSPLVTLGSQPPSELEGSWQSESVDSAISALAVTPMPSDDPCTSTITPASPVSPALKTIQVASISSIHQPKIPSQPKPVELSEELLWLQEKLTAALEHLLTGEGHALNLHQWELDLQVELLRHLNDMPNLTWPWERLWLTIQPQLQPLKRPKRAMSWWLEWEA